MHKETDKLPILKEVFAKNDRGYRLNAIKKRFWSILILLLSVASIRRKLLKTSHTEERSAHTNWENCNIQLRPWKNQFNFKQIIQILQPIVNNYLSPYLYIVDFSYVLIGMIWEILWKHLFLFGVFLIMKTTFSYFPGMFKNPAPAKIIFEKNQKY